MRLHHIGIIIACDEWLECLPKLIGETLKTEYSYVPEYRSKCYFLEQNPISIELIVPEEGKLTEFNKGAGGLHHIAFEVDDLEVVQKDMEARDIGFLHERAIETDRFLLNFIPPCPDTAAVLIELVQLKADVE